jgi:hypothetical protein
MSRCEMKTTHVVRAVAAVLFLASFATAGPRPRYESNQQGDASKKTKPPDGHRLLDSLAGSWDVAIKFKLGGRQQAALMKRPSRSPTRAASLSRLKNPENQPQSHQVTKNVYKKQSIPALLRILVSLW